MDEPFLAFSLGFLFGIRVCVFYDQSVLHGQLLDLQWTLFQHHHASEWGRLFWAAAGSEIVLIDKMSRNVIAEMTNSIVYGIGIGFLSCIGIGIGIGNRISKLLVLVLVLLRGQPNSWYWYC